MFKIMMTIVHVSRSAVAGAGRAGALGAQDASPTAVTADFSGVSSRTQGIWRAQAVG